MVQARRLPPAPALRATFVKLTGLRMVAWQIPLGNTVMRAENDTWGHYQDNRVQWLLGTGSRAHLRAYVAAGFVGFLFGGGADGTTCACDAARRRHEPRAIDGNTTRLALRRRRRRLLPRPGTRVLPRRRAPPSVPEREVERVVRARLRARRTRARGLRRAGARPGGGSRAAAARRRRGRRRPPRRR